MESTTPPVRLPTHEQPDHSALVRACEGVVKSAQRHGATGLDTAILGIIVGESADSETLGRGIYLRDEQGALHVSADGTPKQRRFVIQFNTTADSTLEEALELAQTGWPLIDDLSDPDLQANVVSVYNDGTVEIQELLHDKEGERVHSGKRVTPRTSQVSQTLSDQLAGEVAEFGENPPVNRRINLVLPEDLMQRP